MRRGLVAVLTAALIGSLLLSPASAAIKAGTTCTKFNQSTVSAGYTFTCIKSGKKLVWSKGKTISAPLASSYATSPTVPNKTIEAPTGPLSTPTQSSNLPTFVEPSIPTSFDSLGENLRGIIYGAWKKSAQLIARSTSNVGSVTILVGPNTRVDDLNSTEALDLASKLYSNFSQVKNLTIIKFAQSDIVWAQAKYDQLHPKNYESSAAMNSCGNNGCDGGMAGITLNGEGVIILGQGARYAGQATVNGGSRASTGQVAAHEYVHTIQILNPNCENSCYGDVPVWLLEGNAEWAGSVSRFSNSFDDYTQFRNGDLRDQYNNASMYTEEWITKYLNPNPIFLPNADNWSYWRNYDGWNSYAIGFMVNEILTAVKGSDSVMNIFKDIGRGDTFTTAFLREFGISWEKACPIIAGAIAQEIKQGVRN